MDVKEIQELAKLMEERRLSSLEIVDGEFRLRLNREPANTPVVPCETRPAGAGTATASLPVPGAETIDGDAIADFNELTELKSPMVGTVYLSPSPGEKPFVQVGDRVKKGQVLCILEAMKLMNEYTAPQDGKIVDICVTDGQLAEYGQCLFKIY
ncbi:MAG: acetyl-CoA carboxylase biotin carboxyl carrier protein [Clostridiales bacterium]|nr:acetyl-CoA carboxylase biotin carboxyl carrier protein [Clostridiales bacterium]